MDCSWSPSSPSYTREGKTIWAEVPIGTDAGDLDLFGDVLSDALSD